MQLLKYKSFSTGKMAVCMDFYFFHSIVQDLLFFSFNCNFMLIIISVLRMLVGYYPVPFLPLYQQVPTYEQYELRTRCSNLLDTSPCHALYVPSIHNWSSPRYEITHIFNTYAYQKLNFSMADHLLFAIAKMEWNSKNENDKIR